MHNTDKKLCEKSPRAHTNTSTRPRKYHIRITRIILL